MGDMNLPYVNWNYLTITKSHGEILENSAITVIDFMSSYFLSQVINVPTRGNNILDLFLTNNSRIIFNTSTMDTPLSDHKLISVKLTYNPTMPTVRQIPEFEPGTFRAVDIHECNYDVINGRLNEIDWDHLYEKCDLENDEFGDQFLDVIGDSLLDVFLQYAPKNTSAIKRRRGTNTNIIVTFSREGNGTFNVKLRPFKRTSRLSRSSRNWKMREVS